MSGALFTMLSISCILCYTFQTFFNKLYSGAYRGPESAATPVFSVLYGLIVGFATLAANAFRFQASTVTWALGLVNGFVLFGFNLSSINAARKGPYSLQSIMMLFGNVLLPLLFSALVWKERLGAMALTGIGIMLLAFIVINSKGLSVHGSNPGYFGWVIALFFANGIYGIVMDAQQRLCMQAQRNEMIIITFFFSAVISIVYLLMGQKRGWAAAFAMGKRALLYTLVSALSAAAAVYQMMVLLGSSSAAILYTINNGSIMVLSALLSALVLKEKLSKNTVAGIALAAISLVLVNL